MKKPCIGVILAGGKSARMGCDKAELKRVDESMLSFCRNLLTDCGIEDIRISRNVKEGIPDVYPDCGPLGGIYSALRHECEGGALILPVDMPLLGVRQLNQLKAHGEQRHLPVYYDKCYLPLYLPLSTAVIDYLKQLLSAQTDLRVTNLTCRFGAVSLPSESAQSLINTNTPSQWQDVQPYIKQRGHYGTKRTG